MIKYMNLIGRKARKASEYKVTTEVKNKVLAIAKLKLDKEILNLMDEVEIDSLFDLDKILININKIFTRLGLNEKSN